jgi:hypothetical protein
MTRYKEKLIKEKTINVWVAGMLLMLLMLMIIHGRTFSRALVYFYTSNFGVNLDNPMPPVTGGYNLSIHVTKHEAVLLMLALTGDVRGIP